MSYIPWPPSLQSSELGIISVKNLQFVPASDSSSFVRKGLGALAAMRVGLLCRPLVPTRTAEAKQPETQVCSPTPYFCEKGSL